MARQAGTLHATTDTPASSAIMPSYVTGSSRDTPNNIAAMA